MSSQDDHRSHEKTVHKEKVTTTTEVTDVTTSSADSHTTVHTVTTTTTASEKTVVYDANESTGGMEMTECVKISKTKDVTEEDNTMNVGNSTTVPTPDVTQCDSRCLMSHETHTTESYQHLSVAQNGEKTLLADADNGGMEMTECLPVAAKSSFRNAAPAPAAPAQHQNVTLYHQQDNGGMEMTECLPGGMKSAKSISSPAPQATPVAVGVDNRTLHQPEDEGMEMTRCLPQNINGLATPTLEKTSVGMEMTECVPRLAGKVTEPLAKSPVVDHTETNKTLLNPENGGMEMTECVTDALKRSIAAPNTDERVEEKIESANSSLCEATATMPFNKLVRANNTLMLQRSSNKSEDDDDLDQDDDVEEV